MKNILKAIYEEMDDMDFMIAVAEILEENDLAMMINMVITEEGFVNVPYARPSLFRNNTFNSDGQEVKKYG